MPGPLGLDEVFGDVYDYFFGPEETDGASASANPLGAAYDNATSSVPIDYGFGQSRYDFTQRVFPSDLGAEGSFNGHYMVININVQTSTLFEKVTQPVLGGTTLFSPLSPLGNNEGEQDISKTDALRFTIDNQFTLGDGNVAGQSNDFLSRLSFRPRFTKRIAESIALYMSNSELTFSDVHDFENISLTGFAGTVASGVAKFLARAGGSAISAAVGNVLGGAVDAVTGAVAPIAQFVGTPINPKVEVLFANTLQRQFAFEFLFAPTSYEESKALKQIIKTLRFHAAPEVRPGTVNSFFFVPPSEFDITFYNRGVENTNIPRINTCVLEQIDVSYSPTGIYSTFSNGHPVQVRMMLRFRETEINSKLRVLQGF